MRRLASTLCLLSAFAFADDWTLSEISQWARRGGAEDVQHLYEVCIEGDAILAAAALSALRTVPGPEALEALLAAWRAYTLRGDTRLESAALAELRAVYIERAEAVRRLLRESSRPEVRIAVLALQRHLRLATVREQGREALRTDPASEVRVFAADMLWQLEGEAVLPLLFEVFADPHNADSNLRLILFARLEATPTYREPSLRLALLADDAALREASLGKLARERPQWAADELWKLVGAQRPERVQQGLAGLAVIGNDADLRALLPRIPELPEQAEPELRKLLLACGDARCLAELLAAAPGSRSPAIGAACLDVAWELAVSQEDRRLLRRELDGLLTSLRPTLCAAAYRLLARLLAADVRGAADTPLIGQGLARGESAVQEAALQAFAARPDPGLSTQVVALLDGPACGEAASRALEQAAAVAAPALLAGWPQLTPEGRVRAAHLLGRLEQRAATADALLALLADSDARVRLAATEAVAGAENDLPAIRAGLRRALGDDYFAVRASAVGALAKLTWEAAESASLRTRLLELVGNAEPAELQALATGLRALGARETCETVCGKPLPAPTRAAQQTLRLLGMLGQRAACEPFLQATLSGTDERLAAEAALALSALGSPAGDSTLLELLRDPHPARKELALRALASLRARTGQSFGFDPFLPLEGANAAAWRAWQDLLDAP